MIQLKRGTRQHGDEKRKGITQPITNSNRNSRREHKRKELVYIQWILHKTRPRMQCHGEKHNHWLVFHTTYLPKNAVGINNYRLNSG
jgi:hypothetical protein